MKLLLDMGVSVRTAAFIRSKGHDAIHLSEQGLARLTDEKIMFKAQGEQRVIVTFDLDFSRLIALQKLAQPSLINFRLEQFTTDQVNAMLEQVLSNYAGELARGAIVTVEARRVRLRALPIV